LPYLAVGLLVFRLVDSRLVSCVNNIARSSPPFVGVSDYLFYLVVPGLTEALDVFVIFSADRAADISLAFKCVYEIPCSVVYYLSISALKLASILFKFVEANRLRRGIFAVVLVRGLIIIPRWIRHFHSGWPVYIVLRAICTVKLTWGLLQSWQHYTANGVESVRSETLSTSALCARSCRPSPSG
jgi:hypothetical protein